MSEYTASIKGSRELEKVEDSVSERIGLSRFRQVLAAGGLSLAVACAPLLPSPDNFPETMIGKELYIAGNDCGVEVDIDGKKVAALYTFSDFQGREKSYNGTEVLEYLREKRDGIHQAFEPYLNPRDLLNFENRLYGENGQEPNINRACETLIRNFDNLEDLTKITEPLGVEIVFYSNDPTRVGLGAMGVIALYGVGTGIHSIFSGSSGGGVGLGGVDGVGGGA